MALKNNIRPSLKLVHHTKKKKPIKTVANLKKKYDDLPLNFIFGITEEIDYQCPTLNEYLKEIEKIKEALKKIRRCKSLDSAKLHAAKALHSLEPLEKEIDETTRNNFELLREFGCEWKQLAIRAIDETKNPEKFVKI